MQKQFITKNKITYVFDPEYEYYVPYRCSCGCMITRTTRYAKIERFNIKKNRYYTVSMSNIGADFSYCCSRNKDFEKCKHYGELNPIYLSD